MSFVYGIDPQVSHVAFAFADLDSDHVEAETLICKTDLREGARLAHIYHCVHSYALQAGRHWPAHVAWVEMPAGRFLSPQLYYAVGVIQAALSDALAVPVFSLPSGKWKKWTVGAGNATKPQVRSWVESQRVSFDGQDEADACAIAMAGRAMCLSGRWDQAA